MRTQINSGTLLLSIALLVCIDLASLKALADSNPKNVPSRTIANPDITKVGTNSSTNAVMNRDWEVWQKCLSNIILRRFDSLAFNAFKKSKLRRFHWRMSVVFTVTDDKKIKNLTITSRSINNNEQIAEAHAQAWIKEVLTAMEAEKTPSLHFPDSTVKDKKVVLLINRDFRQLLVR